MITLLLSACVLGLTGSFHCVGMCGPIAMTLPSDNASGKWKSILIYLSGKTITYTLLGLLFGLFGRQLMIAGLQQSLSIAVGALLLIIVCMMYLNAKQLHQNMLTAWISKRLVPLFGRVTHARGGLSALYTGLLNGLLPCGLVYIGIIGSVAAGSALKGMLFMFCFGVGTMPVMLSFLLMAKQFSFNFRYKIKKLAPIFISFVAVLLILRGLNLGIPYLSPSIHSLSTGNENAAAIECR